MLRTSLKAANKQLRCCMCYKERFRPRMQLDLWSVGHVGWPLNGERQGDSVYLRRQKKAFVRREDIEILRGEHVT